MKKACLFLYGASAALMIYSTVFQLQHQLYAKLGFTQLGTIPGGFLMKDGHYQDIIIHYKKL